VTEFDQLPYKEMNEMDLIGGDFRSPRWDSLVLYQSM